MYHHQLRADWWASEPIGGGLYLNYQLSRGLRYVVYPECSVTAVLGEKCGCRPVLGWDSLQSLVLYAKNQRILRRQRKGLRHPSLCPFQRPSDTLGFVLIFLGLQDDNIYCAWSIKFVVLCYKTTTDIPLFILQLYWTLHGARSRASVVLLRASHWQFALLTALCTSAFLSCSCTMFHLFPNATCSRTFPEPCCSISLFLLLCITLSTM